MMIRKDLSIAKIRRVKLKTTHTIVKSNRTALNLKMNVTAQNVTLRQLIDVL